MGVISTFGTLTVARAGIYSAQRALDVVANNIANVNTDGYTRQRVDQTSLHMGGADRYTSAVDMRMGRGSQVTGISQIRDIYMDVRYREGQSNVGALEAKLSGLNQIGDILDEVGRGEDGDGVLEAQFNDLMSQMENLASQGAGLDKYDTLVRSSVSALCSKFKSYANDLETLKKNQEERLRQDLDHVNGILTSIRELNASIRTAEIYGGDALEQKDQRNTLIDELSKYIRISVTYEQEEINREMSVEKLVIKLDGNDSKDGEGDNNPKNDARLVDGVFCTQLSFYNADQTPEAGYTGTLGEANPYYDLQLNAIVSEEGEALYTKIKNIGKQSGYETHQEAVDFMTGSNTDQYMPKEGHEGGYEVVYHYEIKEALSVTGDTVYVVQQSAVFKQPQNLRLNDNTLYGSLQSQRELLTEQGEFATETQINMDAESATKRGIPYYQKMLDVLANKFAQVMNDANKDAAGNSAGVLISNSGNGNDTENITASNIAVSQDWAHGTARILQSKKANYNSTDNDNLSYLLNQLVNDVHDFAPNDEIGADAASKEPFFHGSFQEMLANIGGMWGADTEVTEDMLNNANSMSDELFVERDAVSGVDLNDEAMDMIVYQKSYNAACRLMTTLDELLDKLINGTGRAGL